MAKQKTKLKLKDPDKDYLRDHLLMVAPFLKKTFRPITKAEVKQKKVFKEFFGEESFKEWKLKAIYDFQQMHEIQK